MAKEQIEEIKKPRYHYFCHKCQNVFDSDEVLHECKCGCAWLTVTDRDALKSGYFVDGIKK